MQAMQFPHASRLQRGGLEEDRHGGGVWSVDESSQFLRRAAVPNQPHSSRLNQLDFVQTLQQPPLFEHESVLERNLMLHDRMQHAPYETSMKHFDSSISHSPPVPNSDVLDALARLQGLDVSDVCGRVYPSIQKRQLHPVSSSFEDRAANHYLIPGMDLIDSKWAESNGQLPNNLSEQQLNQLHFMAERQKMDMRGSLFNRESNAWEAFAGNDNPKNGIDELFQQKLALQPSDSFDIAAPSYEDQDSNWFTRSFDSSFKRATEEAALHDSSSEGTITSKLAYFQQDGLKNASLERQASKNDASGRLAIHSRASLSAEQNQLFSEANEMDEHVADSVGNNNTLGDRVNLSAFKDELRLKNNSSKGKTLSNIDQAAGAINFYGYELIPDNAYSEGITNSRSMSFLDRAESSSMKPSQDPQSLSAQPGSLFELATAPTIKTKNPSGFQSAEGKGEAGGNGATTIVPGASSTIAPKDTRFRRTSSHDADAPEASFIDVIKNNTKKPATESEVHSGAHDLAETGHGAKSGKKKGKKGRQIDPSLLGFKVHSNRIMMGEIQRPDD
ncbi:hypothetical protein HPP92_028600 [Vanilla planifolia]|uniref:Uncharacterized protein n=1 Tax=Vanilla planifolia TaxID=51239 RepID=A0A835P752_VANPL|nr:hypothetical protein HPP92_028600 [Vanilla planifolia]